MQQHSCNTGHYHTTRELCHHALVRRSRSPDYWVSRGVYILTHVYIRPMLTEHCLLIVLFCLSLIYCLDCLLSLFHVYGLLPCLYGIPPHVWSLPVYWIIEIVFVLDILIELISDPLLLLTLVLPAGFVPLLTVIKYLSVLAFHPPISSLQYCSLV